MCKEKSLAKSRKSRVDHFNKPITMVKDFPQTDETKGLTRAHSNFQSNSSCNIITVNAPNDKKLICEAEIAWPWTVEMTVGYQD
jgi:hypothetical protein